MKKTVSVTMTFDVELDISDECLTEQALENFSSYMHYANHVDDIFEHVAYNFTHLTDPDFVEGVGVAAWKHSSLYANVAQIRYEVTNLDVETEVK